MTVRMVATIKRYIGLSSDAKPIDDVTGERVQDGSIFQETDTGKEFLYDAEEGWVERDRTQLLRGGTLFTSVFDTIAANNAESILTELKIMNLHLASMSGETFNMGDV